METADEIKELQVTSAGEWAKKALDVRVLILPSGAIFRVKNVDLQSMVSRGYLPMGLINEFISLSSKVKQNVDNSQPEMDGVKEDELKALDLTCRKFMILAILEPRISETEPTSEDVINVNDLGFNDVLFIFSSCVKGGAGNFAPFFQGGQPSIIPRPDGTGIRPKTERPRRNKGGDSSV